MIAIYILWLRQLKRFIRKKTSIVGALGQPIIFLLAIGFGFGPVYAKAGGGNYIQFLAPGIIVMSVLFTSIFTGLEIIWDKQFGFLKETFVAPVFRFEILLGKTLGGATVAMIQGILVFLITLVAGFQPHLASLPLAFLFLFLVAILSSALGAAIAARLDDMQGFPLIFNFLVQPLFYLSGAIFPIKNLPPVLDVITKINPFSYGVDGLRFAFSGVNVFPPVLSLGVLCTATLIVLAFGTYQFSKVQL
ncbi:MAG: multidrug ABC transporter permease [Candidatus Staskawiczbacteria bacterium RIFCSPLOWO2_01_FULL_38_12b]|uniref:Transport permease protein n=1 Tax=Candidatus Staskawiczbacteria bacterium RIFCSPLOWO2_01_FULL_38_12b TaxID=1802214 RepID=A0A1G2IBE7_9BACT|nr:MAG: multidrug ABC transporter permease [Candidatus Staskawiczbacteria bacterium RIFCSPLOWO2_01_FULL_38_12b]